MLVKKELENAPLLDSPKEPRDGNPNRSYLTAVGIFELPKSGEIIAADIYEAKSKKLRYRFFSDGKTYYTCPGWPAKTWTQQNPAANYWGTILSYSTEKDTKCAESFLNKSCRESWRAQGALAVIDAFISDIQREKRDRAEYRKEELRKEHFAMYPDFPEDLEEYCEGNVFDRSYIFFGKLTKSKRRYARCGNCGKKFRIQKDVHQNQEATCPKCGRKSLYKAAWRAGEITDKAKICIAAKSDKQLLLRWANVERIFTAADGKRHYSFSDYAYNLYLVKANKRTVYAYEYKDGSYCCTPHWKRYPNGTQCFSEAYLYTNNLNDVFGDSYYNVDLRAGLEGKLIKISFTALLNNLKNYPAAEYLFKLNMPVLAENVRRMQHNGNGFSGVLGISKQFQPMYSSMSVTYDEHRVIKAYGAWVSPEELALYRNLKVSSMTSYDVAEMLKTMSFGKFVRYFNKQRTVNPGKTISVLMTRYRDYLSMAESLKIDLTRKTNRFPPNCCDAHDAVLEEFNRLKFEAENAAFVEAVKPVYEALPVKEFENEDYCIVLPQLRSDLVSEGKSLRHCVGGNGYAQNHMKGSRLIVFVRRNDNKKKPYFTMEVNMERYCIVQLHGFANSSAPKDVRQFAESFVSALKPKIKDKKRRKTA